jgi:hypothetical protein
MGDSYRRWENPDTPLHHPHLSFVDKVTESAWPAGSVAFSGLAQNYVLVAMNVPPGLGAMG